MARKNKTKKEIVVDIKTAQETDRQRDVIRNKVYPFLLELNDSIGFTKIFLQSAAAALESAFNERSKTMKVSDLLPDLKEKLGKDNDKFLQFYELMKDETASTFTTMTEMMPRIIERYFTQETDKHSIIDMDIEKILG